MSFTCADCGAEIGTQHNAVFCHSCGDSFCKECADLFFHGDQCCFCYAENMEDSYQRVPKKSERIW